MSDRRSRSVVVLAVALLATPSVLAAQGGEPPLARSGPSVAVVGEFAAELGGDRVVETLFTNGETQTMRAGQGGTFAAGLEVRPSGDSPFALRGTVGYKFVTTAAENADIRLDRIPLELLATYTFPSGVHIGGGFVRHTGIRFHGDGFAPDVDFDDANGVTVQAGWRWIAATFTSMTYTDEFGNEYDASGGGLSVSAAFRLN